MNQYHNGYWNGQPHQAYLWDCGTCQMYAPTANVRLESGPLMAVHLSHHKWPGGLLTFRARIVHADRAVLSIHPETYNLHRNRTP
jgi:hypothetical protein